LSRKKIYFFSRQGKGLLIEVLQTGSIYDMHITCTYHHHLVVHHRDTIATVNPVLTHIQAELGMVLSQVVIVV